MAVLIHRLQSSGRRDSEVRCGAPLAQQDMAALRDLLLRGAPTELILDFEGIKAINGSYVRASVAWVIRCAIAARKGERASAGDPDPWAIQPIRCERLFVKNLAEDVREEIDGLLRQPSFKLPCLEATQVLPSERISSAVLLGHLDRQLVECLRRLYEAGGSAKAADLHDRYPDDGVQITAWNNRLAALHERLLIARRKDGRFWIYEIITSHLEVYGLPIQA